MYNTNTVHSVGNSRCTSIQSAFHKVESARALRALIYIPTLETRIRFGLLDRGGVFRCRHLSKG